MKRIVMALCVLLVMCALGNDSSIAEKIKVAQDGNAQAQFELGKCYANGEDPQTQWHPDGLSVCGANNATNAQTVGMRPIKLDDLKLPYRNYNRNRHRRIGCLAFLLFSLASLLDKKARNAKGTAAFIFLRFLAILAVALLFLCWCRFR